MLELAGENRFYRAGWGLGGGVGVRNNLYVDCKQKRMRWYQALTYRKYLVMDVVLT